MLQPLPSLRAVRLRTIVILWNSANQKQIMDEPEASNRGRMKEATSHSKEERILSLSS